MGHSIFSKHCEQEGDHQLGDTMKRSIFVGSALMTVILVFTACGGEATATTPPPQDISLTTVIAMARANEIRDINVDVKNLTVYPKTIARGGADRFVSRIGSTDIIGLLIDSGVEVGPPSGVEVTIKGVSAEDVQSAISAALAQAATPIVVLVTPTPGPATPTANPTTIPLPQRPLIRLHYGGQVYDGVPGNSCWPVEPGASLCADEGPFPWQDLDLSAMPVTAGDSIIVEIEADDRPQKLRAAIFAEASEHASDTALQVIELDPGLKARLAVDLPAGVYNIRITGQWEVGDQAYKFKMVVTG